jgi:LmbE family N-acetylglucosaminyl deacetylase
VVSELVTLVVAPHPDDETIGAGIWIHRHRHTNLTIVQLTDGSPRDLRFARDAGYSSRTDYAAARREELRSALTEAGVSATQLQSFDYVDQELHLHVQELVSRLTDLIRSLRPQLVLSPAYEGGHPDHDTAAFVVAAARRRCPAFHHREYRLYHARLESNAIDAAMDARDFLPYTHIPTEHQFLGPAEQQRKQRMFGAFASQTRVLSEFSLTEELFRYAPAYDFHLPPHPGPLLYERWGWSLSGSEWRGCVARPTPGKPTPTSQVRSGYAWRTSD